MFKKGFQMAKKKNLLGTKVKDLVSDFTGIAVAKIEYMNGCIQYQIQTKVKEDGTLPDARWFDEEQVISMVAKKVVKPKVKRTGGPAPTSTPTRGKL